MGYAIALPDGTYAGTLEVVVPKPRKTAKKVNNFVAQLDYIKQMESLRPGATLKWTVASEQAVPFQSAVCGTAGRLYGSGNYITTASKETGEVELLRVA